MPSTTRKQHLGRGSKLPPIIESSQHSPQTTPPQSLNAVASKENPFRQASRRPSGPSVTTAREFSSRSTGHRKSIATSIDLSKSENIMKRMEKQRRESMVSILPGRRISFGTIGTKITTLLKAKNAFTKFKSRPKVSQAEDDTPDEKAFEIETLPRKPRFASTLSAEAQYAMMKGYEDKVYGNLCQEFPEYRPMLRRNRTPLTGGVVVCSKKKNASTHSELMTQPICLNMKGEADGQETVEQTTPRVEQVTPDNDDTPASTSTPLPGDEPSARSTMTASPVPIVKSPIKSRKTEKEARRLAYAQAKEKQLIMTYRYHCAMDILDVLRKKQGVHSLSPRMKKKDGGIEPLKDYNSWSYVWNHEFEPKKFVKVANSEDSETAR